MLKESQVTQDEEMSSGIPELHQTFSSKYRESKSLTTNNRPEAKDKAVIAKRRRRIIK